MLHFESDYAKGACKEVLEAIMKTNDEYLDSYGFDKYTMSAKEKILKKCNIKNGDVYLISAGTQTNAVSIDYLLKTYEGVISTDCGHIATHEAGAIEYTGHKVITIKNKEGKLVPNDLRKYLLDFYNDKSNYHYVKPGTVYLTHPTEYGTLYTKEEIKEIYEICSNYDIPIFLDGARLGYALACEENDLSLEDIAKYCSCFYIGGAKVGALFGEAVVFTKKEEKYFRQFIKGHGALLAKGRLLGISFDTLFTDDLYMKISTQAIEMAKILREGLISKGYKFAFQSPTNQLFPIVKNEKLKEISKYVKYTYWEKYDKEHSVIRLVTSWYTKQQDVEKLLTFF